MKSSHVRELRVARHASVPRVRISMTAIAAACLLISAGIGASIGTLL